MFMKQQIKDLIQRVDALEHELAFLFYPPFQLFPSDSISPFPLRTSILKMLLISFFYRHCTTLSSLPVM